MKQSLDELELTDLRLLADALRVKTVSKKSAYEHYSRVGSPHAVTIAQDIARVEAMQVRVHALIDRVTTPEPVADCHLCRLREMAEKL